jgi:AraC-like DNA-binding protein
MTSGPSRHFSGVSGLDAFHEAVGATLVAQSVRTDRPEAFRARLQVEEIGGIGLVDATVSPLRSHRSVSAAPGDGSVFLLTASAADGMIEHRRGSEPIRPGRLVVVPAGEAFDVRYRTRARVQFVVIPAPTVVRRFSALDGPIRSVGLSVLGTALLAQVGTLRRALAAVPERDRGALQRVVDPVLDELVAEVVDRAAGPSGPVAVRLAAERFVDRRLGDPRLSAGYVAGGIGVSVRTLHRAFEQPDTLARHIRARRLDRAAERLRREEVTVSEVAADLGFGSASRFAALFRERFGAPPGRFRSD